ncbi:hypothetical protein [Metabacillus fastidiosus]|uniref:hypothetical protein n=1 Tax=Metabacillus fastidiosus TaxID=1458 RepID=UPI000824A803|nr:hypothetical protein [Metabacillus fastidiosus]MED4461848.1 hypothetical protein [Metabacillus fastidiosus]
MDFAIKVNSESETNIVIESPSELGDQILSLLLKEGYTLIEFLPKAIGRSNNNGFILENPDIKYYSLMILAQKEKTTVSDIANCIHAHFEGCYLSRSGDNYLISSDENDFASI